MKRIKLPIGRSDFRDMRLGGWVFVDKSLFVRDVLDDNAQVLLLPRPRRFGKSVNLSMLRYFLEKSTEDRRPLFADLAICTDPEAAAATKPHFQRYPVVNLDFRLAKGTTWVACRAGLARILSDAYREQRDLLAAGVLDRSEAEEFTAILEERATDFQLRDALRRLTGHLARHHGQPAVVLIDEYDAPIHVGYSEGYYDEIVAFFRAFFDSGLKGNPHLHRAVLTGVLRVARESIFSSLNNLEVYSLLRTRYGAAFGFTEAETRGLAEKLDASHLMPEIQRWYNEYRFGDTGIFNPWSVLLYLNDPSIGPLPHWRNTSSNDLIRELLVERGLGFSEDMERLLRGETIEKRVDDAVALREVDRRPELLWSFLLFSGYLKVVRHWNQDGELRAELAIVNLEVRTLYKDLFLSWSYASSGSSGAVEGFLRALLAGDAQAVEMLLERWLLSMVSSHDTARWALPERFYHGMVLGLLVGLSPAYEVRSNTEAGLGRCDVLIRPQKAGQPGVILELKAARRGETLAQALRAAVRQLRDREYEEGLRQSGVDPVHRFAVAFDTKEVAVRSVPARPAKAKRPKKRPARPPKTRKR